MRKILLLVVLLSISFFTKANAQTRLIELLPDSDGAILIDSNRLFNEAIPQIFADNLKKLAEANAETDKIKAETGIDLRQFEEIAIALRSIPNGKGKLDLEALVLTKGKYDSQVLLGTVKRSIKSYREEKVKDTVVYIFPTKDLQKQNNSQSVITKISSMITDNLPEEVAVCALDTKTLAFGSLSLIKEVLTTPTKLKTEITSLLSQKPNAIIRFGFELPSNPPIFAGFADKELEETLSSIQQLFGWGDLTEKGIQVSVSAKTDKSDNAQKIEELLETLRMLANSFLSGFADKDRKVFAKMVNDLKISRSENLVSLNLEILKEDLSNLIR
jgi:hypothetical protein